MTPNDHEQMHDALMLLEEAKLLQDSHDENDDKSHFDDVQSLYQNALSIQESVVGFYHEDTARTYHQMGWLAYTHEKKYHRALSYLLQSLKISYFVHGE